MRVLTGQNKADAAPLVEYYRPLLAWLKQQNAGQKPGWIVSADPLKARP
jgi:peptidyl-dipeptidase A